MAEEMRQKEMELATAASQREVNTFFSLYRVPSFKFKYIPKSLKANCVIQYYSSTLALHGSFDAFDDEWEKSFLCCP